MSNLKVLFLFLWTGLTLNCKSQPVTYSKDIAPIIFKNCTPCHRPGQIAPMPFTSYEEIVSYASMIKYVTGIRYMPPWLPEKEKHTFKNERYLSDREINLIAQWVDQGATIGDSSTTPVTPIFDDEPQMKSPDLVLSMEQEFEQYGVYYDQFKVFVLPYQLEKDQQIEAIEFVPGNSAIVRSCFVSIETDSDSDVLDQWDPQYGYFSFGEVGVTPYESRWYVWTPRKKMTEYPSGYYKMLPKKGRLLFHIHYGPTGVPVKDSSSIRLRFLKTPPKKRLISIPLLHHDNLTNKPFVVKAETTSRFHASIVLPFDMEIRSVMPQSNLLGKKWEIFAVDTSGRLTTSLLKITDWDFKWKDQFVFNKPVILKKGTTLHALAEYDNTNNNLSNPSDPPRPMQGGKRMFEEMFLLYVEGSLEVKQSNHKIHLLSAPSVVNEGIINVRIQSEKKMSLSAEVKNYNHNSLFFFAKDAIIRPGVNSFSFNTKQLPAGNYYFEFTDKNKVLLRHLFVKTKLPGVKEN